MTDRIKEILYSRFGYTSFRPGQREAIESVLNQQDTLVMLATGTGKSLCYQLPTYLLEGATLVVSPLLSLMQDQIENLRLRGEKRAVALNSLTPVAARKRIFKKIQQYKFIYTSPEMLQNPRVLAFLEKVNVELFVVDEAHCISQWGTDFRPDYLGLAEIRQKLGSPTTMALTATATEKVREEIIHFLGLDDSQTHQIIKSVDREEIKFLVELCEGNKEEVLTEYVTQLKGPGIVYFTSKKLADEWARKLEQDYHLGASSYHSDLAADDKIKIQQQFLKNDLQIICATSAFGMGFDKQDIRFIIHYHIPGSPEMYLQETGRASRDGQKGLALLLYQPGDENIQQHFIETSLPTRADFLKVYNQKTKPLLSEAAVIKLAHYFKASTINMNTALATVQSRKAIKEQQLSVMVQYVYQEKCKRNFLLRYFDEEKKEKLNECCSACGLEVKQLITEINQLNAIARKTHEEKNPLPWQKVLQSLYKNIGE